LQSEVLKLPPPAHRVGTVKAIIQQMRRLFVIVF
jgi:hypothetical protein